MFSFLPKIKNLLLFHSSNFVLITLDFLSYLIVLLFSLSFTFTIRTFLYPYTFLDLYLLFYFSSLLCTITFCIHYFSKKVKIFFAILYVLVCIFYIFLSQKKHYSFQDLSLFRY